MSYKNNVYFFPYQSKQISKLIDRKIEPFGSWDVTFIAVKSANADNSLFYLCFDAQHPKVCRYATDIKEGVNKVRDNKVKDMLPANPYFTDTMCGEYS